MVRRFSKYEEYHSIEILLGLQKEKEDLCCENELNFLIVPQVCELHFKLVLHHLEIVQECMDERRLSEAIHQLKRLSQHISMATNATKSLEWIEPNDFAKIRLVLGNGSGQDSPGFKEILKKGPKLFAPFMEILAEADTTIIDLYRNPKSKYDLFLLMQELLTFDQEFKNYRYQHMILVKRMIGINSKSLKGAPAKILEVNVNKEFFPKIWASINEFTQFVGTSY
ncbi:tryptophan 2,3-dioxygenase family protein [Lysinibacillus sp. NPDC059133]|uniref:tryptophan 2,3-dioxygenase family protein n=1 Tax=Lysinibacillus sp. NPDC059133 TaxID=3346737 RepID=UPI0036837D08